MEHEPELLHARAPERPQVAQRVTAQRGRRLHQHVGFAVRVQHVHEALTEQRVHERRQDRIAALEREIGPHARHQVEHRHVHDGGGIAHRADPAQQLLGLVVLGEREAVQVRHEVAPSGRSAKSFDLILERTSKRRHIVERWNVYTRFDEALPANLEALRHLAVLAQVDGLPNADLRQLGSRTCMLQGHGDCGLIALLLVAHRVGLSLVQVKRMCEIVIAVSDVDW
jgi:hypothetical protein